MIIRKFAHRASARRHLALLAARSFDSNEQKTSIEIYIPPSHAHANYKMDEPRRMRTGRGATSTSRRSNFSPPPSRVVAEANPVSVPRRKGTTSARRWQELPVRWPCNPRGHRLQKRRGPRHHLITRKAGRERRERRRKVPVCRRRRRAISVAWTAWTASTSAAAFWRLRRGATLRHACGGAV